MKKKLQILQNKKIYFIFFMLFCIINCYFIYSFRVCRTNEFLISDSEGVQSLDETEKEFTFDFESPVNNLKGLNLYLDTDSSIITETTELSVRLYDDSNVQKTSSSIKFSSMPDGGIINVNFDQELNDALGKNYKVILTFVSNGNNVITLLGGNNLKINLLTNSLNNYQRLYLFLSVVLTLAVVLIFLLLIFKNFSLTKIFIGMALLFGLSISILIPIGNMPDESRHIYTAYHFSNVLLGIKDDDQGIMMRYEDTEVFKVNGVSYTEMQNYLSRINDKSVDANLVQTTNQPLNVKLYSFTYFPQAFGITIGRLLGLGTVATFLLGRLFNFLTYVVLSALALAIMPKLKVQLFFIAMLPMSLQQAASFSYDALTMSLAFCIAALSCKIFDEVVLSKKEKIFLVFCTLGLLVTKQFAYFALALVPSIYLLSKSARFYVLKNKMFNFLRKYVHIYLPLIIIVYIILCFTIGNIVDTTSPLYFALNPIDLLRKIDLSIIKWDIYYYRTLFTGGFGTDEIQAPDLLNMFYFALFIYMWLAGEADVKRTTFQRLLFAGAAGITIYGLIYAFQNQTPLEWGYIWGIQGRYFTPILFPIMFAISKKQLFKEKTKRWMIFFSICLCYIAVLEIFLARTLM